jgi:hypothetical protein
VLYAPNDDIFGSLPCTLFGHCRLFISLFAMAHSQPVLAVVWCQSRLFNWHDMALFQPVSAVVLCQSRLLIAILFGAVGRFELSLLRSH